jgi:hypothetical protein
MSVSVATRQPPNGCKRAEVEARRAIEDNRELLVQDANVSEEKDEVFGRRTAALMRHYERRLGMRPSTARWRIDFQMRLFFFDASPRRLKIGDACARRPESPARLLPRSRRPACPVQFTFRVRQPTWRHVPAGQ